MKKESRKTLLIVTSRFPYPVIGGERLRIHEISKELAKEYNLILLSIFNKNDDAMQCTPEPSIFREIHKIHLSKFKSYLNCVFGIFSGLPLQVLYYQSKDLAAAYEQLIQKCDGVLIHLIRCAEYAKQTNKPKFLEMTDAISLNYSRIKKSKSSFLSLKKIVFLFERERLYRYELKITNYFNKSFLVSDIDKEYLGGAKNDALVVATNGVEFEKYEFNSGRTGYEIAFIGNMISIQNLDAAEYLCATILPLVKKSIPNASVKLIGRLSKSDKLRFLNYESVIVSGEVESISEAAKTSTIGVCSVRIGAGIQNKILEYMALGLPTVTTDIGYEGLSAKPGGDLLVGNTSEEICDHVVTLLKDPGMRKIISENARTHIEAHYLWANNLAPLVKSIREQLG